MKKFFATIGACKILLTSWVAPVPKNFLTKIRDKEINSHAVT